MDLYFYAVTTVYYTLVI